MPCDRGGVAILYRESSNLTVEQHRITTRANGSSHQAVSWTITSPLIVRPIHITGVYVSPSGGAIEDFFYTLTQQDHYPAESIHIYAGDFNAHVGNETETQITTQEGLNNPPRVGDCYDRHMPSPPAAAPITIARISSTQRGRLLLGIINTTSFFILNGRYEAADDSIPYDTLQNQDEATINDYNLMGKQHFSKVKTCHVILRPSRTLRSKSGPLIDHNPIVVHLSFLAKSAAQGIGHTLITQELPPRTQFHSSKLKDATTGKKSQMPWRTQAGKAEQAIRAPD